MALELSAADAHATDGASGATAVVVPIMRGLIVAPSQVDSASRPDGLVFYTHPMSRGRVARWMLEEVGQPYDTEILDYSTSMKSPAYLAINPMGKVPALRHGATIVTECAAVCAYLADAFPQAELAPVPGHPDRGAYLRWMFFGAGPLEAAVTNRALGLEPPAEKRGMVGYGSYEQMLDVLEAGVAASPYLAGPHFSAADIYVGSQIGWGMMFGTIEKRPAFEAYYARIAQRPAALRATALDDALLPKQTSDANDAP